MYMVWLFWWEHLAQLVQLGFTQDSVLLYGVMVSLVPNPTYSLPYIKAPSP